MEQEKSKLMKWLPLILAIVVLGLGIGLFYAIKKVDEYKNMFEATKAALEDGATKYNQAKILLQDKQIELDIVDKKLAEEIGSKKAYEEIVVKWVNKVKAGGTTTIINNYPVSESAAEAQEQFSGELTYYSTYGFDDFRISVTTDTKKETFVYELTQEMGVKIYKLSDYDYRAEIIEYNRLTHEPVTTFTSTDFNIKKVYKNPDKFSIGASISLGGNVAMTQDLKFSPGGYVGFNFMYYGASPMDAKFRFATIAAGTNGAFIIPFSYNLGRNLPLFNDLYIDLPLVGIQYKMPAKMILGIGLSSTL